MSPLHLSVLLLHVDCLKKVLIIEDLGTFIGSTVTTMNEACANELLHLPRACLVFSERGKRVDNRTLYRRTSQTCGALGDDP